MKKMVKFFGIIAFSSIIGFTLASCDNGTGNGGNNGGNGVGNNISLGTRLSLSGPTYLISLITRFYGDVDVQAVTWNNGSAIPIGAGTGAISGGQLNFIIDSPPAHVLGEIFAGNPSINISPAATRLHTLDLYILGRYRLLLYHMVPTATSYNDRVLMFIYSDRPATISSKGHESYFEFGGRYTRNYQNAFNISLQQGWNAIHSATTRTDTATGRTNIHTISPDSAANRAGLRWFLDM